MFFIISATVFYSLSLILLAAAARRIDSNLAAGITNLVSAIIPIILAASFINKKLLTSPETRTGLIVAVLAGLCIALFAMSIAKSFTITKVSVVVPLIYGGSIFLTSVMSVLFLKEKISTTEVLGILVLLIGVGIISYARFIGK